MRTILEYSTINNKKNNGSSAHSSTSSSYTSSRPASQPAVLQLPLAPRGRLPNGRLHKPSAMTVVVAVAVAAQEEERRSRSRARLSVCGSSPRKTLGCHTGWGGRRREALRT